MIPSFVDAPGAPYRVLPPGIHWASLSEVEVRFATNTHRAWLFEGLARVAAALRSAGCERIYLGGSYVTAKEFPTDFNGCWDPSRVDGSKLDPVLLDFANGCAAQKQKYRGEMFISTLTIELGSPVLDLLQLEKHTGSAKGIVALNPSIREKPQ
jgi:hypothetical protein